MLNLSKGWSATGTDIEGLAELLKELDANTEYITVKGKDVGLKSVVNIDDDNKEIIFRDVTLEPGYMEENPAAPTISLIYDVKADSKYLPVLKEEISDKSPLVVIDDAKYFLRNEAIEEAFFNNCRLRGSFFEIPSLERDKFLLRSFQENRFSTFVVRKYGDCKKIFAVRSGRYRPLNQSVVIEIFNKIAEDDSLGSKKDVSKWSVDHDITTLYVEFPDLGNYYKETYGLADEIVPGIKIENSGTGKAKLKASEVWRIGSVIFEKKALGKIHRGEWSVEGFVNNCKDEIFKSYTKLPERLGDLWGIDFVEPGASESESRRVLTELVSSCFKELHVEDVFASKTDPSDYSPPKAKDGSTKKPKKSLYAQQMTKAIVDAMVDEFVLSGLGVTAYDIATSIMLVADRLVGIPVSYVQKLKNCCGEAAFCKYELYKKRMDSPFEDEGAEPEVYLAG